MLLRVYVPLWMINATQLPIQGLLSIITPPKPLDSDRDASVEQTRAGTAADSSKLRILEAKHQVQDQR